jgi:hypothetical protein
MPRDPDLEEMLHQPPDDDLGVREYLDALAAALATGDGAALMEMCETPGFVLGEGLALAITETEQVTEFFGNAREQYRQLGIVETPAEIVRVDEITDTLVMVRVRWPYRDAQGREMGAETATYTLTREPKGDWKLRVAVVHGKEALN